MQSTVNKRLFQGTAIPWLKTLRSTYFDTSKVNLAGWRIWQNISLLTVLIVSLKYSNCMTAQGIQQHDVMRLIWARVETSLQLFKIMLIKLSWGQCMCVCVFHYSTYGAEAYIKYIMHNTEWSSVIQRRWYHCGVVNVFFISMSKYWTNLWYYKWFTQRVHYHASCSVRPYYVYNTMLLWAKC